MRLPMTISSNGSESSIADPTLALSPLDEHRPSRSLYGLLVWWPVRTAIIVLAHLIFFAAAYGLAFQMRFDFRVPEKYQAVAWNSLPVLLTIQTSCFFFFRSYSGWWRYFTFRDLISLAQPLVCAFFIFLAIDVWL